MRMDDYYEEQAAKAIAFLKARSAYIAAWTAYQDTELGIESTPEREAATIQVHLEEELKDLQSKRQRNDASE